MKGMLQSQLQLPFNGRNRTDRPLLKAPRAGVKRGHREVRWKSSHDPELGDSNQRRG